MTSRFDTEAIGSSVSKCSNVMAGDASNAMVQRIYRSITFRRAANWEAMRKKISSPFAVHAISKSMGRTVQSHLPDLAESINVENRNDRLAYSLVDS